VSADEALILAVDGGGSKTDAVLLRGDGRVLSALRGPGSSPQMIGLEAATEVIDRLVATVEEDAGVSLRHGRRAAAAVFFMAGADLPEDELRLAEALEKLGWAERTQVANDGFALLWAATGSPVGIACVVGSGINCVGRLEGGRRAWFPALGAVTGDWGGGRDIGLAALGAAVRGEDRRDQATRLAPAIAAHFGCATALEVAATLHHGKMDVLRLPELVPVVAGLARDGDPTALAIFARQADAVVTFVRGAVEQLEVGEREIDIVLGGGVVVRAGGLFLDQARAGIREVAPHGRVIVCRDEPVLGAALAGLALGGTTSVPAGRLRTALDEARVRATPAAPAAAPPPIPGARAVLPPLLP